MNKFILYIILTFILLGLLLLWFIPFKQRLNFKRMYITSLSMTKNLGYIIWLTGKIRSGKTVLMTALTHLFTFSFINELSNKMSEIEDKLPELPFNKLKNIFLFNKNNGIEFNKNVEMIINDFKNSDEFGIFSLNYNLENGYFNFLKYQDKIIILNKYFEYFENLNRENYVYSNILIWNQIKASYSYNWKNEYFHVKDNKEFPLEKYMIICYDEKTLQDANDNSIKKLNADNGSSIPLRLLGNGLEETVIYMATLQDINRLVSYEREIGSCYLYVNCSYIVGNRPGLLKFISHLRNFNNKIYSIVDFLKKDPGYKDKINHFKKFNKILRKTEEKIISESFVFFETSIYSSVENVGKKITEELANKGNYDYNFCLPVCYCWDNSNTHFFKPLFDYLINRSTIKRDELSRTEIDLDYIENILTKYTDKSSNGPLDKPITKSNFNSEI